MKNKNPPLIAHIIFRLDVGGLENGLVNLINRMPESRYRHAIICMDTYTDFRDRIQKQGVECYALNKKPGQDLGLYVRLWKLLCKIRPDVVHTRNVGTLECVLPAMLARVKSRVHGEHGRDMTDIDGSNRKYILLRKILKPFVSQFVAVSQDLENWLTDAIGVNPGKVIQIYNGVDTDRFTPQRGDRNILPEQWVTRENDIVIGTVGRFKGEKDQRTLILAVAELLKRRPEMKDTVKLVLVGDGPLAGELKNLVAESGLSDCCWFTGSLNDVSRIFSILDIFVLPSLGEGISNTILEAMASGLPVLATRVGGNSELVIEHETGALVPADNPEAMSKVLESWLQSPALLQKYGTRGRERAVDVFSMDNMVNKYLGVYDQVLGS